MKGFSRKTVFVLLAFFVAGVYMSCSKQPAMDLEGVWSSTLTYKTDLGSQLNPLEDVGAIYTKQTTSFTFNADGTYTRTATAHFDRAESYTPELTEEMLVEMYGHDDVTYLLKGTYTLVRKNLELVTDTVVDQTGKEIPYEEFFKEVQSFGASPMKVKINPHSANEIEVQGIVLKRQ